MLSLKIVAIEDEEEEVVAGSGREVRGSRKGIGRWASDGVEALGSTPPRHEPEERKNKSWFVFPGFVDGSWFIDSHEPPALSFSLFLSISSDNT